MLEEQISVSIGGFTTQILGSRLILNLREAYYKSFDEEYTANHLSLLPIEFALTVGDVEEDSEFGSH